MRALMSMIFLGWQTILTQLTLQTTIPLKEVENFTADQFGNLYIVKNDILHKLNPQGKELFAYSNPILGEIKHIDALNALNPLLFYQDVYQVIILDNRLNQSSQTAFADYGFLDVRLVAYSDQENIWFYDQVTDKLYRFNIKINKITAQTLNITQIAGKEDQPEILISTIENIYLYLPDTGILVFDPVGAYIKTIFFTDVLDFEVEGRKLYCLKKNLLVETDLFTQKEKNQLLNLPESKAITVKGKNFYILHKEGITHYISE